MEENDTFAIATLPGACVSALFAREALRDILRIQKKKLIIFPDLPEKLKNGWNDILPPPTPSITPKVKISIPKEKSEEVAYHEEETEAAFVVTPKGGLTLGDVRVAFQKPEVDAAFLFFNDAHPFFRQLQEYIILPQKDKMAFFGEKSHTYAEKIYTLAHDMRATDTACWPTLLYLSLAGETEQFAISVTPNVFSIAGKLLEKGADNTHLPRLQEQERRISHANLLGRALARTQIDEERNTSWTFLAQKDFLRSQIAPEEKESATSVILPQIRSRIPNVSTSFMLWEKTPHIHFCAWSKNPSVIARIATLPDVQTNEQICTGGGFENFTQAELRLRQLSQEPIV